MAWTDAELRSYAADLIHEHAVDIESLSIHEMAEEFLGGELEDGDFDKVNDWLGRAFVHVKFEGEGG